MVQFLRNYVDGYVYPPGVFEMLPALLSQERSAQHDSANHSVRSNLPELLGNGTQCIV